MLRARYLSAMFLEISYRCILTAVARGEQSGDDNNNGTIDYLSPES
jgi:hypothetical protein